MIDILLTSIIIIIIMLFFVYIMFKNIVKRINQNAKAYFINKLDDYNDIVEEKEKRIQELSQEIKALEKNKMELEQFNIAMQPKTKQKKKESKASYNLKVPKFREENFFSNYKELKKTFDFDKEELIKDFIKNNQNKKHERDYKTLLNFKNKFDKEAIYQLTTLSGEEQIEILNKILTPKEKEIIDVENIVPDKRKFSILKLFEKIDEILIQINPIINIYVSKYEKDYDYIDPYIRTKHYAKMSEGIIIEYQGKTYDYSI